VRYVFVPKRVALFATASLLLFGAAAALRAQPSAPLALDEALEFAAARSQQLVAEDAAAAAAREMSVAAAARSDPTLTAGLNNVPVDGPDRLSLTADFMTMRSIGFMRELTRGDKRDARAARYLREADVAEAARTLALVDLQRSTATAWLDRHYLERARDVLRAQRDDASLQVEAADLAFRSGVGSQADVFAARSSVALIDDRIAENARDLEGATLDLERWVGDAATRPLGDPPTMDTVALHTGDLESTLAHHPEIALMEKREQVARAEADVARANKRSDWTIEVTYSQRGPDFSNMMSLEVSKPLQLRERNRQDRELAAKLATADQMRAMREEETRAHVADAQRALAGWRANRERLTRYRDVLIPLAAERTRAATAAYRGDTVPLSAVLEARVAEIDTRLGELRLERETAELWAALEYLIPAGAEHEPR
jgi:outer membrane protein TolC